MAIFTALLSFFLTITRVLYYPQFPPLPFFTPVRVEANNVLTLPVRKLTATEVPPIGSGAFLVIDQESGEVLAEREADQELPPASTTKIMTAVVILEHLSLQDKIKIPEDYPQLNNLGLKRGEIYRVSTLLQGMLVHSSNELADLLAANYPGGQTAFIEEMNTKASQLGMIHTKFKNTNGLPEDGHVTTVRDLLILARYAMNNPIFAADVVLPQAELITSDGKAAHLAKSTNKLLTEVPGIQGIKTGYTEEAGECLVTQVTRDGHTILTALLRSSDRFADTKTLINWVYDGFHWDTKTASEW